MPIDNLNDLSCRELSRLFIDATTGRHGVNAQDVEAILGEAYSDGVLPDFSRYVFLRLDEESRRRIFGDDILPQPVTIIPRILDTESMLLSSERRRLLDIYENGQPLQRRTAREASIEGLWRNVNEITYSFMDDRPSQAALVGIIGAVILMPHIAIPVLDILGVIIMFSGLEEATNGYDLYISRDQDVSANGAEQMWHGIGLMMLGIVPFLKTGNRIVGFLI